jgi:hypothetical protein
MYDSIGETFRIAVWAQSKNELRNHICMRIENAQNGEICLYGKLHLNSELILFHDKIWEFMNGLPCIGQFTKGYSNFGMN